MTIFGTRPEAIKMAPVVRRLKADPASFDVIVVVTAQHREMLDQVLQHFEIKPDYDLNIMTPRQTLTRLTSAMLQGLEKILADEHPDIVLVHGDATTTFAASLAAFYAQANLGHVEAGLRTYRKYSPWPEEMNRRLTGILTDLHFPPTPGAKANLIREGVPEGNTYVTGNTAIDALLWTVRPEHEFESRSLKDAIRTATGPVGPGAHSVAEFTGEAPAPKLILVECHRRENWGQPMLRIYKALRTLAEKRQDVRLLVSAHLNPEAGDVARRELKGLPNALFFPPVAYSDWVNLMARCYLIVSDSGGLQEEAPSLGRPLILVRENTERPEAVEAGTVRVVGTSDEKILKNIEELLDDEAAYQRMAKAGNPFGDGHAADRIARALLHHFARSLERPEEFEPARAQ